MKMKILLIGGSGFLGAWISRVLQKYLFQTRIMDLVKPNLEWHRLSGMQQTEWIQGDISIKSDVENASEDCDGVVNLAGLLTPQCSTQPLRGAEVNLLGTIHVFEAALKHKLKLVTYTSSIGVYGPHHADFPEPTTHYGSYKLASEGVARAYFEEHGLPSLGVRPFVVYGPGREVGGSAGPSIACRKVVQKKGYQIPFTGMTGFVYAQDVAEVICHGLMENNSGASLINITGVTATVDDFIDEIQKQMPEAKLSANGAPLPVFGAIPNTQTWPLRKNYEPTTLNQGISMTLEYYKTRKLPIQS